MLWPMAFNSDNVRVFLAVLDTGSFSAAARSLGRVPSAVSMTIAQLEAECVLDVALLALVAQPLDGRLVEKALHLCTEKQR